MNKWRKSEEKKKRMIFVRISIGCIILLLIPNIYFFQYFLNSNKKVTAKSSFFDSFTVMSYNIRCHTFLDIGKKSWFYRANLVLTNIGEILPDIVGFQEVTPVQYQYLKNNLRNFGSIIEYRNNYFWSEGCPIFFNENIYELVETGTFWLSETPEKISKSWGAADYRICSYVVLRDKDTNSKMAVFNTHLDHESEVARINGMDVIQNKIKAMGDIPIILMGDFNVTEDSKTYQYITELYVDSKYLAKESEQGGTFQNWGKEKREYPIDYIIISKDDFKVKRYYIWKQLYDEIYPSDHFPVCVELKKGY